MSFMIAPIIFGGYAPDAKPGMAGNFSRDLQNIRFNEYGGIETLDGYSGFEDSTCPATRFTNVFGVNSLSSVAVDYEILGWGSGNDNPRLYQVWRASLSALSGFTEIDATNHEENYNAYFTVLANKVLISTSSGEIRPELWTGTPATSLSTMADCPPARYPSTHYNRIFLASSKANPSRVWWSPLYLSAVWTTGAVGNWVDVNRDDGDFITGIRSFGGDLLIWKTSVLYKIIGNDFDLTSGNFSTIKIEGVPGTHWNNSIVEADGALYWYSPQGFVKYQGGNIQPIGYGFIDKEIRSFYTALRYQKEQIRGAYRPDRKEIWWTTRDGARWFIYNVALNKWSIAETPHHAHCIYTTSLYYTDYDINVPFTLYGGTLSTGGIHPAFFSACAHPSLSGNTQNWNGTAIDSYYCSDYTDLTARQHKDSPRIIFYPDGANNVDLSCSVYFNDNKGNYDPIAQASQVFSTNEVYMKDWYPSVQSFYRMQIKIGTNILNKKFIMNKIEVEFNADTESGRI